MGVYTAFFPLSEHTFPPPFLWGRHMTLMRAIMSTENLPLATVEGSSGELKQFGLVLLPHEL